MADIFRLRTSATGRETIERVGGKEVRREGGRRHHSSFSCLPKSNESKKDERRRRKRERERKREEDRRERRGRKGHKLGWTPFCSTIRKGKKTRRILDPMERIAERGRASGDGGHSSDSTDGAKERMMIEWGKSGEKLDRGERERGEGQQRIRTRHSKREREEGRGDE